MRQTRNVEMAMKNEVKQLRFHTILEEERMMFPNLKPGDEVKVKDNCRYFTWSDTWNGYPMNAPTKVEFVGEYDRFVELHCWFTNTFFGNDADYVTSVDKWRLRTKQVTIEPIGEAA